MNIVKKIPAKLAKKIHREVISAAVVKERKRLEKKVGEWRLKIETLQKNCKHYNLTYKNDGYSGGWDNAEDYWIDWNCLDCKKHWTTEQTYSELAKYPHAVEVK